MPDSCKVDEELCFGFWIYPEISVFVDHQGSLINSSICQQVCEYPARISRPHFPELDATTALAATLP
ncbi:hypothetical protein J2X42_002519 [Arthrobacter sp. BE255]|nr:hypothetical protein [Arthrobacter sp. BE255]